MEKLFVRKLVAISLAVSLTGLLFAGCADKSKDTEKAASSQNNINQNGTITYPLKTEKEVTFKYWREIETGLSKYVSNNADTDFSRELEKRTGVKIQYIHPPSGSDNMRQAFNIMIASRELPDMIEYNFSNFYPGGPAKAITDNVIFPLNDLAKNNSPDLLKYLEQQPEIRRYCTTDNGELVLYPSTVPEDGLYCGGPMIREDMLKELNLPVPETIQEWYNTLKKLKESGKVQYPLSWSEKSIKIKWSNEFCGAFGVSYGPWQKDRNGKVQYGPALPQYKDFLTEMNKWYKEGLIDPEFSIQDQNTLRAKVSDGKIAAYLDAPSGLINPIRGWRAKDPDTKKVVVGAPHPVLNKGEPAPFGTKYLPIKLNNCVAITTACKNPEIAAQYLNYGYTGEGSKLYTYGVEGQSYTMQDGKPIAADWIIKPPANSTKEQNVLNWVRYSGPFITLNSFVPAERNDVQESVTAMQKTWTNVSNELKIPEMAPPADKADRYAALFNELDTYTDEMFIKFIMGMEPLDHFDQYLENLKKHGVEECIQIQQQLLDGWNKR